MNKEFIRWRTLHGSRQRERSGEREAAENRLERSARLSLIKDGALEQLVPRSSLFQNTKEQFYPASQRVARVTAELQSSLRTVLSVSILILNKLRYQVHDGDLSHADLVRSQHSRFHA